MAEDNQSVLSSSSVPGIDAEGPSKTLFANVVLGTEAEEVETEGVDCTTVQCMDCHQDVNKDNTPSMLTSSCRVFERKGRDSTGAIPATLSRAG